jgi:DNA-binding CsgD family transcriptional regulator/tetratricopeptide (TPR) repeat protein
MNAPTALDRGRAAYQGHRWGEAIAELDEAEREDTIAPQDLEHLATALILVGRAQEGVDALTRAHEAFLAVQDTVGATRCAAWLGMHLMNLGDRARSAGWFARAQRLVEADPASGSGEGFLLIPEALGALYGGDGARAADAFGRAAEFAHRLGDPDLIALSHLGQGQAKILVGDPETGLRLLDEVMVAVTAGEVSPIPSGIVYCAVLQCCRLAFDVRRAREWTRALDRWCKARPDMVAFSGQCQAHRAALFVLHGEWSDALAAAESAQERSARGDRDGLFSSWYQDGEVHRLRGDQDLAESSYERAAQTGWEPQPGLALLRLAQGKAKLAQSLILGAVDRANPDERRWMLPAVVEIELAARDVTAARKVVDELNALLLTSRMPMMQAIVDQAEAAVLLDEGDAGDALVRARRAWARWRELDVPYEAARCRVLAARACRALGDEPSALMELDAARAAFTELGARDAFRAAEALMASEVPDRVGGLTPREVEVLRLVAAGKTNRMIAEELYLSEKTVARHLSNIFAKLGVSSRAAATAFAYQHEIAG